MKAFVNPDLCIGCGLCTSICDEVFRMNDNSQAEAYAPVNDINKEVVNDAINSCPVSAISWEN